MPRSTLTSPAPRNARPNAPSAAASRFMPRSAFARFPVDTGAAAPVRWSWACRGLAPDAAYALSPTTDEPPRPGDVALVRVRSINNHTRLTQADSMRLRLYPGVVYVGAFGNRYATDSIEAEVDGIETLHQLTGAGMIGTFRSRERTSKGPTKLDFLGFVADADGARVNLREQLFHPRRATAPMPPVVLLLGTGMNAGKTATAAKLSHGLFRRGLRVAACKATGSVSRRDYYEMKATGAVDVREFSDYGFPSTYLCSEGEVVGLFHTMLADAAEACPDVVIMEVADGILQRETQILLRSRAVRRHVAGTVLAARCAPSALLGSEEVVRCRHAVWAVSGLITNSPLFMREFSARSPLPLGASTGEASELVRLVAARLGDVAT